ncbi:girdin isoform X2 [Gouania willdenowi]|uniref:girdin isoform X2 n=1 Tax=Gouania willdenowi TaxID=441366 RepID=UPI001056A8C9|nr:girdin-like isoform X2 [Gouania willdenowi]
MHNSFSRTQLRLFILCFVKNQKALKTQIEEMNRRVSYAMQHRSDIQEQLREANNKISQACLDKAKLMTQVLKLENHVKELELKLTEALLDNKHLIKEKEDFSLRVQALERQQVEDHDATIPSSPMALTEMNEKLNKELQINKHSLQESQNQLQALEKENINHIKQKAALEMERFQLIRENKELLLRNDQYKPSELSEINKKSQQNREELELEKQRLWDQCLCLQADVQEKEKMLHIQKERHHKQDLESAQAIEELRAMTLYWNKKWQKVAQSLQSTQEELYKIRRTSKHELPARVPEDCHDDGNLEEDAPVDGLLRNQQDDNQRKMDQLEIQKTLVAQDLQTLKKVKDEKPSVEDKRRGAVCLVTNQQRRMVNEQLKSLFKEQEKQAEKVNTLPAAAPAESSSSQERSHISKSVRAATDRRNWQSVSGLMPVLEEDEESCDPPEELEGEPMKKTDETLLDQRQQKSSAPGMAVWDLSSPESLTYLDDSKKKWTWSPPPYPDGIFGAKIVDICSPDECDEEGDVM